jgi:hypothetical protein
VPGDHARSNALPARCQLPDLVGSTALSTKLDPEDLRSVIGAYHNDAIAAADHRPLVKIQRQLTLRRGVRRAPAYAG